MGRPRRNLDRDAESIIRVSRITKDRVKYVAGTLALTQSDVVEQGTLVLIQSVRVEFNDLVQALMYKQIDDMRTARRLVIDKLPGAKTLQAHSETE